MASLIGIYAQQTRNNVQYRRVAHQVCTLNSESNTSVVLRAPSRQPMIAG